MTPRPPFYFCFFDIFWPSRSFLTTFALLNLFWGGLKKKSRFFIFQICILPKSLVFKNLVFPYIFLSRNHGIPKISKISKIWFRFQCKCWKVFCLVIDSKRWVLVGNYFFVHFYMWSTAEYQVSTVFLQFATGINTYWCHIPTQLKGVPSGFDDFGWNLPVIRLKIVGR